MNVFSDAVCIVTGGAAGLGGALCEQLSRTGSIVVVADIDDAAADRLLGRLKDQGGRAASAKVDVTVEEEVRHLVARVVREHGRLDLMFNNAGINTIGEFDQLSLDVWRRMVDVNLWGVVYGTRAAYQAMLKQGRGHIVNIASGVGLFPVPFYAPYAATKFAIVGLTESLRIEAADRGIDVSVACPGWLATSMLEHIQVVATDPVDAAKRLKILAGRFPMQIMGADASARRILRGVQRKQARIAFPFYVRLFARVYHLWPLLSDVCSRRALRDLRRAFADH